MNLVKWIRKNEHKLMVWLLVLIMIAFVGGAALQQILRSVDIRNKAVALYSGGKITGKTLNQSQSELTILKALMADKLLMGNHPVFQRPDFRAMLLSQVLFPESFRGEQLNAYLKQSISRGQSNMSEEDVDEFFLKLRTGRPMFNWILLKAEAKEAGCVVSTDQAKYQLTNVIQGVSGGQMKTGAVIDGIVSKYGVTEEGILSVYADLMSVLAYANIVTGSENITTDQIKASVGLSGSAEIAGETINAEYVKVAAKSFTKEQAEPSELELNEQFVKFNNFRSGYVTDDNPYGFGYKLPAMVNVEYLVVQLKDVIDTVAAPTDEEMMDYYNSNPARFTRQIPVDPNDPTGPKIDQKQSYAKVAYGIKTNLKRSKSDRKADMIIAEAVEMTTANLGDIDIRKTDSDKLKELAVDYAKVADELTAKHGVKVYTGTTGLTGAVDLAGDSVLGNLIIESRNNVPQRMVRLLFATQGLEISKLGPFDRAMPKKYENIGPAKDGYAHVVIVRVIDTTEAKAPESIDYTYSINKTVFGEKSEPTVMSIKEKVTEDFKIVKSMQAAKSIADELAQLAGEKGFKEAINTINEKTKDKGVILFSKKMTDRTRLPQSTIKISYAQIAQNPGMEKRILSSMIEPVMFIEKLFSLVSSDENELKDTNKVIMFEPDAGYYVIKDVSVQPVSIHDYEKVKAFHGYATNFMASEALGLQHFRIDNIQKRMSYKEVEKKKNDSETEEGTN
ncbi:MAG: hypothetical protein KAS23_02840 [Anaerohalosphaera sp.]|nr:hypothetical protein [Anaerohalosphaera sp.]